MTYLRSCLWLIWLDVISHELYTMGNALFSFVFSFCLEWVTGLMEAQ